MHNFANTNPNPNPNYFGNPKQYPQKSQKNTSYFSTSSSINIFFSIKMDNFANPNPNPNPNYFGNPNHYPQNSQNILLISRLLVV